MKSKVPYLLEFPTMGRRELGYISVAEGDTIPFDIKRVYWTYHTPQDVVRGNHAHIDLEQVLVAVSGVIEIEVTLQNGEKKQFTLNSPNKGLYLPNMCWRTMKYSHNAVQMCLASAVYDEQDYIREINEFDINRQL